MLCRAGPGDAIFPTFWRILIGRNFCFKKLRTFVFFLKKKFVGVRWGSLAWVVCLDGKLAPPFAAGTGCTNNHQLAEEEGEVNVPIV